MSDRQREELQAARIAGRLLGAVLRDPKLMQLLVDNRITSRDIASPHLQKLWSVMREQWASSRDIKTSLVQDALEALLAEEKFPITVAHETIEYCLRQSPVRLGAELPGLIEHMRQRVALRELKRLADEMLEAVDAAGANASTLIDRQKAAFDTLLLGASAIRSANGAELAAIGERLLTHGEDPDERLLLGLPVIDGLLVGGAPRGEPTVIGAGTGVGKSTFATFFALRALEAVEAGRKLLWFSFEADRKKVSRLLHTARAGFLYPERPELATRMQAAALAEAHAWMADHADAIHVEDVSGLTVEEVRSITQMHCHVYGVDTVLVDYAQDIERSTQLGRDDLNYAHISRELRKLTKDERLFMLEFSQVRELEKGEKRLSKDHTAFSKQFGRDAAVVLMLEGDRNNPNPKLRDVTRVSLVKNRINGRNGEEWLRYDHRTNRLTPCTEQGEPVTTLEVNANYIGTDPYTEAWDGPDA